MDITTLAILTLATFRLTSFLTNENEHGPFDVFDRLRAMAGIRRNEYNVPYSDNQLGRALLCPWCTSVWVGAGVAVAWYAAPVVTFWISLALGLSAGAIAIEGLTNGES